MALKPDFSHLVAEAARISRSGAVQKLLAEARQSGSGPAVLFRSASLSAPANKLSASMRGLVGNAARVAQRANFQAVTDSLQAALRTGLATVNVGNSGVLDVHAYEVGKTATGPTRSEDSTTSPEPGSLGSFISATHAEATDKREYKLYIPPNAGGEPLPLVMMLHGCTQNPDDFAAGTGMNEAALKRGFYVLYPAQTQHANSSRCWNWFKHNHQQRGRGEPALLAGMSRDVIKHHNIDPQRVYVAGLSAGGAMAAILGDTYPDLFAAVGVHSGLATGSATDLQAALAVMKGGAAGRSGGSAPVPTIVFHGDRDVTVNPVNGEHVTAASAGTAKPETTRGRSGNGREYTRSIYRQGAGEVVAEHWVVHGAGHAWSGGHAKGSYTDPKGPDASEEMLRFFFANRLR
jgi:poly(hydroxyalkanoate) depolymerase family esterase